MENLKNYRVEYKIDIDCNYWNKNLQSESSMRYTNSIRIR